MKRILILVAIIMGCIAPAIVAQNTKQKVAVYVTGETEAGYKKVIGSKLVSGITRSDKYSAVERTADFLAALVEEQDYQTSGAVSDNQIVKLGQQFGVRYVLVADISEVFESMFISARMIDVQTGQITCSSESSATVNSMQGLTGLSEEIILGLFGEGIMSNSKGDNIKVIGPFLTEKGLYEYKSKIPSGYRMATKEEIEGIVATYKMADKKIYYPICTSIQTSCSTINTGDWLEYECTIDYEILNNDNTKSKLIGVYHDSRGSRCFQQGITFNDKISDLFMYLVKDN